MHNYHDEYKSFPPAYIADENGKPLRMLGAHNDLTSLMVAQERLRAEVAERKRAEEALVVEKERAEVTLHSIGDAVITTNAEGVVG